MKPSDNIAQQTIAVLGDTDFAFSMQVLDGVQNFASRLPAWRVLPLHCTQDDVLDDLLRQGRLDGVIGAFISERWVAGLPGRPVPLVNVGGQSLLAHTPSVLPDERAIGRLVAAHFLEGGWRVLGCLHDPTSHAACQRREGFVAAAASRGLKVSSPPPSESFAMIVNWEPWLRTLRPPAAIFCTSDLLARRLIQLLQRLDARVPEAFAVAGAGDSAFDSVLAGMGISSVALPGRSMGQRAAARLHDMLTTGKRDQAVEFLPPETLVVRESSALVRTRDAVVSRAVGLMLQHPSDAFSAGALARRVGLSRRALEMRFQRAIGHGPATEMRRRRLLLAQRLLTDTNLTLEQISERAGFCGAHHLAARFKQATGMTAGTYRRQKRI